MIIDVIDGYIQELESATKKANLFKHEYKKILNSMRDNLDKHSKSLFSSRVLTQKLHEEMTKYLDKLDDEFGNDIKLFYLSLRQYLLGKIPNSDDVTCIARASVIEVLSSYSIMNDNEMYNLIRKIAGRPIGIRNDEMKKINFQSREYIHLFSRKYKDIDANLNDCEAAVKAFEVINNKMSKIPEIIYEDRTN